MAKMNLEKIFNVVYLLSGIVIFFIGIYYLFMQDWGLGISQPIIGLLIIYVGIKNIQNAKPN